ncbi:MAG: hypothetical protein ACI4S4_01635, partial [Candidatus Ornithospirochaeta sp.]
TSVHQALEYYNDFAGKLGKGTVASVNLVGSRIWNKTVLEGTLGYMLTADSIAFENPRSYLEAKAEVSTELKERVSMSTSAKIRYSVDKKGSVPVFISDGYIGQNTSYGATGLRTDSSVFNVFVNADILYRLPFDPTFGEFLILENPSIGIYSSALFSLERIGINVGAEIKTTGSLIGLVKLPLKFRVGYEIIPGEKGAVTASLSFSSIF